MNEVKNKKLLVGLSVSVIVNALLIGFIISHSFSGPKCYKNYKSFDKGKRFNKVIGESFWDNNESKLRELREEVKKAISKEPYDEKAVVNAFNKLETTMSQMKKDFHKKIANKAKTLSPEERLDLFDKYGRKKRLGRKPGRRSERKNRY